MDLIAIRIPKLQVQEGSAFTATANFRTRETAAASAPTTVHYRLDCLTTGTELKDWTDITAAAEVAIAVTATHNAIQSDMNDFERKQLTVAADKDLPTQQTHAVRWRIENLYGMP